MNNHYVMGIIFLAMTIFCGFIAKKVADDDRLVMAMWFCFVISNIWFATA